MTKESNKILYINMIYPDAKHITKPAWPGEQYNIYIVKTAQGKYVCRFSGKQTAEYNLYISELLQKHNIKVPCISVHNIDGNYIETYPFINGKTFYERLVEGMPEEKSSLIYEQLFNISYKITQIDYDKTKYPFLPWIIKAPRIIFKHLNPNEKQTLCHNDIHAKNVILDENDNIRALIDMDSICPGQFSFATINMIAYAKLYGLDTDRLVKLYQHQTKRKPILDIKTQTNIYYYMLKMYLFSNKHLLNMK